MGNPDIKPYKKWVFMAENAEKSSPRTPFENTSEIPMSTLGYTRPCPLILPIKKHHFRCLKRIRNPRRMVIRPICKGNPKTHPKKNLVRYSTSKLGIWFFWWSNRHSLQWDGVYLPTKWAPTSYKWGYNFNPYKWHEKCAIGDKTLPIGNITSTYNQYGSILCMNGWLSMVN